MLRSTDWGRICLTYSDMWGSWNTLGETMHYIFGIFRPLRRDHACDNVRAHVGSAKTDLVWFKWGFGEGLLKDISAFSRLLKILYLRGENCLQNAHFYKQKGPCLKRPSNWTGSVFPLLSMVELLLASELYHCIHQKSFVGTKQPTPVTRDS